MNLSEAIRTRRSVRSYSPRTVDEGTVHHLLAAAVHAPSAMNQQAWGFAIVQDRAQLKRYSDLAKSLLRASTSSDPKAARYAGLLSDEKFNIFYDAGTLVAICTTSQGPYADADCWLAAENLMLAACDLGLGTCPIGFAILALNTEQVKQELGVPLHGAVVAPIIVGYAAGEAPPTPRAEPRILFWSR